jgi:V/A-type H+/Na+-transporting ATPase subunit I
MFKPLAMQYVTLWVTASDAAAAALTLARFGIFSPEVNTAWTDELPETPGEHYRTVWLEAHGRLGKIGQHFGPLPPPSPLTGTEAPTLEELEHLNGWLGELWKMTSACEDERHRIEEERQRNASLFSTLARFHALDIDLGWLTRPKRLLDTRVGSVPEASVSRLAEALTLSGFLLEAFGASQGMTHAVVAGPAGRRDQVRAVLDDAGWQDMVIPPELLVHPDQAHDRLQERNARLLEAAGTCETKHDRTLGEVSQRLAEASRALALAEPYARLSAETLRAHGGLALMTGWMPANGARRLERALDQSLAGRYVLQLRDPSAAERDEVPSALRYPNWLGPFAELVRTYGVPRYGEFDPTLLFAISFVLMFGMMFGDVGQGALIALGGLALPQNVRRFRPLLVAAGLASVAFGFLYGSVFGVETLVDPLWISPLHDPVRMLLAAVYWGMGFILVTQLILVVNRMASGRLASALFDAGGVAGMVLYLGAAWGLHGWFTRDSFGPWPALLCAAGLASVLGFNWHTSRGPLGERLLGVIIESFESLIGFFANTLSFMRVAAFSINHGALALAVFAIADNFGHTGKVISLVLGNLVILVLEGAIVAIQVLRLEYYEGFSRFFSGDGRAFNPLTLAPEAHLGSKPVNGEIT